MSKQQPLVESSSPDLLLGIDIGTQGLTCLLCRYDTLEVIAKGEGSYGFVPDLPTGHYEQDVHDWLTAMDEAMQELHSQQEKLPHLVNLTKVKSIGISGQMHGQVLIENSDYTRDLYMNGDKTLFPSNFHKAAVLSTVRLWCDARNQEEANELSELFGADLPKRATIARWLWTCRNQPEIASQTTFMTTPAGWLSFLMTQQTTLGIGDASGMFPIDTTTNEYDPEMITKFNNQYAKYMNEKTTTASTTTTVNLKSDDDCAIGDVNSNNSSSPPKRAKPNPIPNIEDILPKPILVGNDAGVLTEQAAHWLGLTPGIPVAAAEGDQPAALVGSLIGQAGMVSCSFGTSVCANLVGSTLDPPIRSPAVNHFCDPNGKPIYMVWLRNGTTFFNSIVKSYQTTSNDSADDGDDDNHHFDKLVQQVISAPTDCGGLIALPFMDDEPGLNVHQGGTSMLMGWNPTNSNAGNACKAALLSTMFNLKKGTAVLQTAGIATTELILTGGLAKTPECGQILADVFNLPVKLLEGSRSDEGCSWGAAVLAKYRYMQGHKTNGLQESYNPKDWPDFLATISSEQVNNTENAHRSFHPNPDSVPIYDNMYQRYQTLLELQPKLQEAVAAAPSTAARAGDGD